MRFTIYQESRPGKRPNNEDRLAHCYSRDALMMVIADGMGGHYYGEIAAQIAVQGLTEAFQREANPKIHDPFSFLNRAMLNAHRAILDFTEVHKLDDSPRTTCVACLIQDNIAYWAHAGDSRLYVIRGGKVLTRTRDHSRVQLLIDQGIITEAQAAFHPDRNKVYSCLGGRQDPDIELSRKTPLEAGDVLALCTDGLWGLYQDDLLAIANESVESAILHSIQVTGWSLLWMACGLILIAAVDVPFQLWDSKQKLMMTKQEVKDEYKDSEGKPEVKSKIRQLQRQMAERRMMQQVPEADVVITNPTHFAVALKYDPAKGNAPVMLAKGGDFLALKIREIAQEHKVTLLESPALARAVYYSTEVDQEIPAGLYLAVAQVLAYVYQLKQFRAGKGKRPGPLPDLPIPPDLRRDE